LRILIADDDAMSRRLLQTTLERAGYSVTSVDNGSTAARLLCETDGPRLALLDWVMPGMDGPAVVRAVRRSHEQPYVHMILLTSKQAKEDIVEGLDSGADDYLTKPFHPQELKARLRTGERVLLLEDRLVEAREEMRFRATHDPLTSLWNRGMIEELLTRELQRVKRDSRDGCVSLVLGDVDRFKAVNDTYGHAVGDAVLCEVAARFRNSVRDYDAVSRYGGEEFLILLAGCAGACATSRAEQIRRAIESRPIQTAGGPVNATVSLGVVVSSDWRELSGDELIREADAALYHAKREGRNLVGVGTPSGLQILEKREDPFRAVISGDGN
jgi:two-component system cell cycle response regulator